MWRISFIGCLLAFIFLNSCITALPPLMNSDTDHPAPEEWIEYGAYYEYDELRIFTEELYADRGWDSNYYVNLKLHILNRKGLKYATIELPKYAEAIIEFSVTLRDPTGKKIPLNLQAIRAKYLETGKIVVHKAVPGCQIGIKVIFGKTNLTYSHEHWFEKTIPVMNARFSLIYPRNVKYECKSYGRVVPAELQQLGVYSAYVWDLKNVMPEDDAFDNRWHIDKEPHVIAHIKSWDWQHIHYISPDWKSIARKTKEYYLSPSFLTSNSNIKEIISGVIQHQNGMFEKADAILVYVQNEISLDLRKKIKLDTINLNNILLEKSGNRFEIAVLLRQMFKAAGFIAHIYVTRPKNRGGFDPDFPTWYQIDHPLVAVEIDGKELIAYPLNRFMAIGEYPFVFRDLQALDIENGNIVSLPKSTYLETNRISRAILSPEIWEDSHSWQLIYCGELAAFINNKLGSRTADDQKAYFQSFVRGYDQGNELQNSILMKTERKAEVDVRFECRNIGSKTERNDLSYYSLKPWFRKYFTDYDISRKTNYVNDMALVFEDSVMIKKNKNTRRSYRFECDDLDNPLFRTQCSQKETDDSMLLSRRLTVKEADLTPEQMQTIDADIVKLNRIDESYMMEKP